MGMAHARNLRKGRFSGNNQIYLVTSVTEQRRKVFADFYLARIVVDALRFQHKQEHVESLAFVVMPDHFHWLFVLKNDYSLAKVMQGVKGRSSRAAKLMQPNCAVKGMLWQKGYHDHALRKEDVLQVARYIVANPLRAGLVKNLGGYPFWDAVWL